MTDILATLREFDAIRDSQDEQRPDRVLFRRTEAVAPAFADADATEGLPPCLKRALEDMGVERLYAHQAETLEAARRGEDVVIESPTASGKTLAFALPVFEGLLDAPEAHALFLTPMKALSNDQRRQLLPLEAATDNASRPVCSWLYNGDTDKEHRKILREYPPAILMTNPEMLHQSFLGWSDQWEGFLSKVRYIVIDEVHEYRGYFGSQFALLLRRLLLKLESLGARPQLIMATATCGNPQEHAERLTGRKCTLVRATGAMRPAREFRFINPLAIPDHRFMDIYTLRIARAALAAVSEGMSVITFCPSRKFAEAAAKRARRDAAEFGIDPDLVAPYRSGYRADERRKIEDGLRNGDVRAVFSTNALELGIDIGKLDVCVLAGFPDSAMSAWQRVGRVGRGLNQTAHVLYYAMNNAVDQFYAENIDAFLEKPLDHITVGLENQELIAQHVPYLLHESDWDLPAETEKAIGGAFREAALAAATGKRRMTTGRGPSYQRLCLRGTHGTVYKLMQGEREIGTISDAQAFREAHMGAIYSHCGRNYRVMTYGQDEIGLEEAQPHRRTVPTMYTVIQDAEYFRGVEFGEGFNALHGRVTLYENLNGYREEEDDGRVVANHDYQDARSTSAHALVLTLGAEMGMDAQEFERAARGLEHLVRVGSAFIIPADRHDTSTTVSLKNGCSIYLYESYPGGIGIVEKAYSVWPDILREGIRVAAGCSCKDGCPRCIYPPRVRDAEKISKRHGLMLAARLLERVEAGATAELNPEMMAWEPVASEAAIV